jgi:WD40 repeat protein/DNA-binding SARP family transcriptional activator
MKGRTQHFQEGIMTHLSIQLLGRIQIISNGEPVTGFDSDKVRALLAYLAVESDRSHRRGKLAGLLWPDFPERSARTSLRRALTNLRKVIGDQDANPAYLLITRQTIQFNRRSDHTCDLHAFTALMEGETGRPPEIQKLEKAIDLYKGDFMEGFSLPDNIPFDEWTLVTRESLIRQALWCLSQLTSYYQEVNEYEKALRFSHQQVEMDPYQEAAHQQVMWSLAQSGQRNEALVHYEGYRQFLEAELGIAPLEGTQEMYNQLQEGKLPVAPSATVILRREPREVGENPYRGLAAFREEDSPFFYGREAFTLRLMDAVMVRSLVAVILGSSGSGKSSAVFAGLLPRLRELGDWLILHCRPGGYPFQALARSFTPILEPDLGATDSLIVAQKLAGALQNGDLPLYHVAVQALENVPGARRLILVVDQFEELYTQCPEGNERRCFLDELLSAVEAGAVKRTSPFVLLLTLRADFMGQALTHRPFADALQDGSLILGPMNRDELRSTIEKPAKQQGAAFETGLVARILDDVGGEPGNLPLLEFALALLWERLDQGWATHAAYDEIRGVGGALARYAENVYAALEAGDQEMARQVFVQLIQPGEGTEDTRRVASRTDFGVDGWDLVQHLADKRLVVTGIDERGTEIVEVVHEALIRGWHRLGGWMDEDRVFRTWQERLRGALRQWEDSQRDEGALLRGAPLVQAEAWWVERGSSLSQTEYLFIEASLNLREQEQIRRERRRRRTILGLATGLVFALVLAFFAGQQWLRAEDAGELAIAGQATAQANAKARATAQAFAEEQARIFKARELSAAAITHLDVDPELSILLALQAVASTYDVDQTVIQEAEEALHRSIQSSRTQLAIRSEDDEFWMTYFSPDGAHIVAWSVTEYPGNTRIYNANTGEELGSFPGVIPLGVHPENNQWIGLALDFENNLETYSIRNFSSSEPIEIMVTDLPSVDMTMEAYDWNFNRLARPLVNGETGIWDLVTGQETLHLGWEGRPFDFRVAFSPDGDRIVTGHMDGTANVLDLHTGEFSLTLTGHTGRLTDVAFSPNGKYIATASGDGTAKLWDGESGKELVTLVGHSNELMSLAFNQDSNLLATGGWDRIVKVWDLMASISTGNGQERMSLAGHTSLIMDINFSHDGLHLSSASWDGTVRVWDICPEGRGEGIVFTKEQLSIPEWSPGSALNTDGTHLATTNADNTPKVWNTKSGELLLTLSGHQDRVQKIEFSPDGVYIVTTGHDNLVKGWDARNGLELFSLTGFDCSSMGITCDIAFSPDGSSLAIVDNEGMLRTFSYPTLIDQSMGANEPELLTIQAHEGWIWDVVYSPDGKQIITTGKDKTARVWDAETGMELNTMIGHEGWVLGVSCSPDNKRIVTASSDGTSRVWDAMTGESLLILSGHTSTILQAVFSPDGTQIATASSDMTVKLWDAETGQGKLTLYGHSGGVTDVTFSPDGNRLYTTSRDGTDRVYLLNLEALITLAQERLTRWFTEEECYQYLHLDECPPR